MEQGSSYQDFEKEDSGEDAFSGTQEKSVSIYVR